MKIIKNKIINLSHSTLSLFCLFNFIFCNNLEAGEISLSDSTKKQHDLTLLAFYQHGMVLPTNVFVRGKNMQQAPIDSYRAFSLLLTKQTTGEELWEQLYGFPRYGIGIYSAQFNNTSEPGKPIALYGTLSIPLFRWENFTVRSDIGLGLAVNWHPFSEDRYNVAIGGEMSSYVDAAILLEYKFKDGLLINIGTSDTHFSNGALRLPNLGINTFAPKISIGYNFVRSAKQFNYQVVPEYQHQSECYVSLYTGWENKLYYESDFDSIPNNKGVYYSAYGVSATFNRQISYKSKFGVGFVIGYLGGANTSITKENGLLKGNQAPFSEGLELSIFPSYELVINRLSIIMQPGFYLYRTKYPFRAPSTYQRIGFKFNLNKDISLGMNMHAHLFSIADYIEWTIGYRLPL